MNGMLDFCQLSHICKINQPQGCQFSGINRTSTQEMAWVRNFKCPFPIEIVASNLVEGEDPYDRD